MDNNVYEFITFQEEKLKAYRREQKREKKRKLDDSMKNDEEDEMAAIMGFSGFGSSKAAKNSKK